MPVLRDKAYSNDLRDFAKQADVWVARLYKLASEAFDEKAVAHSRLYSEAAMNAQAAASSIRAAATIMDPDLTSVEDFMEELS